MDYMLSTAGMVVIYLILPDVGLNKVGRVTLCAMLWIGCLLAVWTVDEVRKKIRRYRYRLWKSRQPRKVCNIDLAYTGYVEDETDKEVRISG